MQAFFLAFLFAVLFIFIYLKLKHLLSAARPKSVVLCTALGMDDRDILSRTAMGRDSRERSLGDLGSRFEHSGRRGQQVADCSSGYSASGGA
jgi:hypothetical protein